MNAPDTQNASLLFSNVRRSRGHDIATLVVVIASWVGVAAVTFQTYQNPETSTVAARV
jgi:hypothetical protein